MPETRGAPAATARPTGRSTPDAGSTTGGCDGGDCPIETVATGFLDTGCTTSTVLGPGYASEVAADGTNVYWTDRVAGLVVRCAIDGCALAPTPIATSQVRVVADQSAVSPGGEAGANVALDGEYAYWADATSVYRKRK
jgi:hypothetical protein